ncbi:hypothetical protein [Candidatus Poriferisocius sp.]|uniref:hypothetical protein n=1 Tax=Candidatus Poriferisocius sp. TaxID=3101276 RepID=UPI003B52D645
MRLDDIAALPVDWVRTPPARFVRQEELEAPGEALVGRVVYWSPDHGALSYDRTRDVGLLILSDDSGWMLIALEKAQLGTTVEHAIAAAAALGLRPGDPALMMVVRYLGMNGNVKQYRATIGVLAEGASTWPS